MYEAFFFKSFCFFIQKFEVYCKYLIRLTIIRKYSTVSNISHIVQIIFYDVYCLLPLFVSCCCQFRSRGEAIRYHLDWPGRVRASYWRWTQDCLQRCCFGRWLKHEVDNQFNMLLQAWQKECFKFTWNPSEVAGMTLLSQSTWWSKTHTELKRKCTSRKSSRDLLMLSSKPGTWC